MYDGLRFAARRARSKVLLSTSFERKARQLLRDSIHSKNSTKTSFKLLGSTSSRRDQRCRPFLRCDSKTLISADQRVSLVFYIRSTFRQAPYAFFPKSDGGGRRPSMRSREKRKFQNNKSLMPLRRNTCAGSLIGVPGRLKGFWLKTSNTRPLNSCLTLCARI